MKTSFFSDVLPLVAASFLFLHVFPSDAGAYEERNHIAGAYRAAVAEAGTTSLIKAGGDWFPYPEYKDREGWARIFGADAGRLAAQGEKYLRYEWKLVPATAYLEYERTGERKIMENPFDANRKALNTLILAELAEGKGRFMDQIADGLWMSCQMTSWVLSAHNPRQSSGRALPDPREYIIDLGSGGYGAMVAVAYHFFKDELAALDPSINYCIETAVRERILDPYFDKSVRKSNWWMADDWKPGQIINNWNPWCNSNVLLCFLLMEQDQQVLDDAVELSVESVDRFLNFVKSDGACEEGPSYWGHAAGKLYDYLEMLYDATGGRVSLFDNEQIRNMGEYISRSYIGDRYVVNFADATASLTPDIYLTYRYGKSVHSSEMMDFAISLLYSDGRFRTPAVPLGNDTYRSLEAARVLPEMSARVDGLNAVLAASDGDGIVAALRGDVPQASWYPETEFCYLRDGKGNFFAAKGGFNDESHNHNDVGTFIFYPGNRPMFIDAGVCTYTKKTFSSERYTIWSMQSEWHNLPVINGVPQSYGREYRSSDVSCSLGKREFSLDMAGAYPETAGCSAWKRSYKLSGDVLKIRDSFSLTERKAADVENFLVLGDVCLPGGTYVCDGKTVKVPSGKVIVAGDNAVVEIAFPAILVPSVTDKVLDDPRLTAVWGDIIRRISFTSAADAPVSGHYDFVIRVLR